MFLLQEHTISCPYCWQAFEIVIDSSVASQEYVEDCYVCCRPIVIRVTVSGDEAREHARLLARHEGVFGGFSAGANLAAAIKLLRGPEKRGTVAFVICDSGLKYLSTDLWQDLA